MSEQDTWRDTGFTVTEADAIRKVESLLRLAAKHPTEAEGIAAAAKAQQLLTAYNLDMATVERGSSSGKREDAKMKGGLYHYQRDLWEAVAKLNFCLYWNQYVHNPNKTGRRKATWKDRYHAPSGTKIGSVIKVQGGYDFVHRVVGRVVNTTATRVMAEYLEQTIERLTRERLNGEGSQFFTKWAISYREGIAERVIEKIYERRSEQLSKERKAERARQKREQEAAAAPFSSATTLTISAYSKTEEDANYDVIYGEGWSAKQAADRAARAKARAEAEAAYTAWAKAHPEEVAAEAARERKEARKSRWRGGRASYRESKERDYGAYKAGMEAGANVSIDLQAGQRKTAGLL